VPKVEDPAAGAGLAFKLVVEHDFILTIVGGRTRPIALKKIQCFLFWLKEKCGFQFGLVTADTFQSE
jgi:hypothetical protein